MVDHHQGAVAIWSQCTAEDTGSVRDSAVYHRLGRLTWACSVTQMVNTFLQLYSPSYGASPWQDLSHLAASFEWTSLINSTTVEYLDGQGINPKFTREMVESATRVNYGQVYNLPYMVRGLGSLTILIIERRCDPRTGGFHFYGSRRCCPGHWR